MARMHMLRALALAPLFALGCAHATPVVAAPLAPEEMTKLQATIVGTCDVTSTQKEGSDSKDKAEGLSFTFNADGSASYTAKAFGTITTDYKYKVEGRNILMDGPMKAFRADDYSGKELKFFVYDLTQFYYCTKR